MRFLGSIRKIFLALVIAAVPASSFAGVFISVAIAPPALPVYTQPICPVEGYMWTPGYWAYGDAGYYWVPGVWLQPPAVGVLWTPGYWGWGDGVYAWHRGYWGPHVGFYGGVNYGFGYGGIGFGGGYWGGGHFYYNTAVMHVDTTVIHNTYNRTVINNTIVNNRVSFNGGPGGINARATASEMQASREARFQPTAQQVSHREIARQDRGQLYSENHGRPAIAARSEVGGRATNQQDRIAAGARDGQLNRGEVNRDEARQGRIDNSIHNDRQANGGKLTNQERKNINKRQDNASRQIHNEREKGR
jgi:hypothetical protein